MSTDPSHASRQTVSLASLFEAERERDELRAEVERLRVAAQAVIDSINDENEIDPDAIKALSDVLGRHKDG